MCMSVTELRSPHRNANLVDDSDGALLIVSDGNVACIKAFRHNDVLVGTKIMVYHVDSNHICTNIEVYVSKMYIKLHNSRLVKEKFIFIIIGGSG